MLAVVENNDTPRTPISYGRIMPAPSFEGPHAGELEQQLLTMAAEMGSKASPGGPVLDVLRPPAGYTYFSQFVDHDLSNNITDVEKLKEDPDASRNARSAKLDLDHVYDGPSGIYESNGTHFKIGLTEEVVLSGQRAQPAFDDLPRVYLGGGHWRAVVADERADQNMILSQMHVAFMKAHNRLLTAPELGQEAYAHLPSPFERARQCLIWHYQYAAVEDWLRAMTLDGTVEAVLIQEAASWLRGKDGELQFPIEMSAAAFRFGHTMVRGSYSPNGQRGPVPLDRLCGVLAERPIPSDLVIDWEFFFRAGSSPRHNFANVIDTYLAPPLAALDTLGFDGLQTSLAARTLIRGARCRLPSGQALADFFGVKRLALEPLIRTSAGWLLVKGGMLEQTPLFYYILAEAEHLGVRQRNGAGIPGTRLGPLGSLLLAKTIIGLLKSDLLSYLNAPAWKPFLFTNRNNSPLLNLLNYGNGNDPAAT